MRSLKVSAVLVAWLVAGCATLEQRPRQPDVAKPPTPAVTADFRDVFAQRTTSNSVYAAIEPGLLRRVMLSPNLVFESSRSSVDEPPTHGPQGAPPSTPNLADALGRPVDIWLSSALMSELTRRKAHLVAPAASRYWADVCDKTCNAGTWLERLLVRYRTAKPGELEELPTAALAVRDLGLSWRESEVVATRSGDDLIFRPRQNPTDESACKPTTVQVPQVRFSAELVSLRDGRILARIDETRTPSFRGSMQQKVDAARYTASHQDGYEFWQNGSPSHGRYQFVASWAETRVECENALSEYKRIRDNLLRDVDVAALAKEILAAGLDPLAH
jgi:hypothetical protein